MDVEQGNVPVTRASDRERDVALQRLQVAFGEGRLTDGEFDERMRAAELDGPVTTIFAVAYKSEIEIIVPPGVRVELGGFGTSGEVDGDPGPNAPIIVVRGFAYKGSIEARTSPSHH
jgi:hypothetical protein